MRRVAAGAREVGVKFYTAPPALQFATALPAGATTALRRLAALFPVSPREYPPP
jgi:hypothetical protein